MAGGKRPKNKKTRNVEAECQLLKAVKSEREDFAKELISKYPDIINCREANRNQATPLHYASGYNMKSLVQCLLKYGADINSTDRNGLVALHKACHFGRDDVALMLIQHGAEIHAEDGWKCTAFDKAEGRRNIASAEMLIRYGAKKTKSYDTFNNLYRSMELGYFDQMLEMINKKDLNLREEDSLLFKSRHPRLIEYLLRQGLEANTRNAESKTPLHLADTHWELTKMLLKYNAHINALDETFSTPLHKAAASNSTEVCHLLLSCGADPLIVNALGKTAAEETTAEHIKILLREAMTKNSRSSQQNITENPAGPDDSDRYVILPSKKKFELSAPPMVLSAKREFEVKSSGYSEGSNEQIVDFLKMNGLPELGMEEIANLGHGELKELGVSGFGERKEILNAIKRLMETQNQSTEFTEEYLNCEETEFETLAQELKRSFWNDKKLKLQIIQITKIHNQKLWDRYVQMRHEVAKENQNEANERMLFHGSKGIEDIKMNGFDERYANIHGMFGSGVYFADHARKSDSYTIGNICRKNTKTNCTLCTRELVLCRVTLGKSSSEVRPNKLAHGNPGFHSISAKATPKGLNFPEFVVHRGEQAYPEYVISYRVSSEVHRE